MQNINVSMKRFDGFLVRMSEALHDEPCLSLGHWQGLLFHPAGA